MPTSSGGGGRSMLTVADRGEGGGGKICQNLADVICERYCSWGADATRAPRAM